MGDSYKVELVVTTAEAAIQGEVKTARKADRHSYEHTARML